MSVPRIDAVPIEGPGLTLRTEEASAADDASGTSAAFSPDAPTGPDFGTILAEGITQANQLSADASTKAQALMRGASDDIHGTMISSKEADIAIKLVGTVRNKLLDAFNELWRINL